MRQLRPRAKQAIVSLRFVELEFRGKIQSIVTGRRLCVEYDVHVLRSFFLFWWILILFETRDLFGVGHQNEDVTNMVLVVAVGTKERIMRGIFVDWCRFRPISFIRQLSVRVRRSSLRHSSQQPHSLDSLGSYKHIYIYIYKDIYVHSISCIRC